MVFVVAEIGVNWDGDLDLLKKMMSVSKESGCNAVKFQAFTEQIVQNHPQKSRLMKSSISENNVEIINETANSIGIEWFCTPMYPEAVIFLNPFVKRFKIREFDGRAILKNEKSELFESIYRTEKEIIISSQSIPNKSDYFSDPRIKWLYCVPKYPCKLQELNFNLLNNFDGYSNHSPELIAPVAASVLGSKIIEVHITSDKSQNFIDNDVSFDFNELKNLLSLIRQVEKINL